jgi:hypothetical protein
MRAANRARIADGELSSKECAHRHSARMKMRGARKWHHPNRRISEA